MVKKDLKNDRTMVFLASFIDINLPSWTKQVQGELFSYDSVICIDEFHS
jgi:hypothetical protein